MNKTPSMCRLKTKLLLLFLVVPVIAASACSAIVKRETWPAEIANTGWVQFDSYLDVNLKFQYENVTITVRYDDGRYQVVWLGPLLFPIIPLFREPLTFGSWSFSLPVKIESSTDTTTVDFSDTRLWISKDKSIPLTSVKAAHKYIKQDSNIVAEK